MSTLKVNTIRHTGASSDAVTLASDGSCIVKATNNLSNRRININGAMNIAQRATSVTSVTTSGYRTCDRQQLSISSLGTWTVTQESDGPDGFSNSLKVLCTTADGSPAAGDYAVHFHHIEAQDLQQLAYGTSNAKAMVLSFWVKSNKTGNATVELQQNDASNKRVTPQYSISSANTWEKKTISIPGDTSGVINDDNGTGMRIGWWFNSGSTYQGGANRTTWTASANADRNPSNLGVGGAVNDYFQITGVQLEVGDVATDFEHRSYGDELLTCMRYYQELQVCAGNAGCGILRASSSSNFQQLASMPLMVPMRDSPSCTVLSSNSTLTCRKVNSNDNATATLSFAGSSSSNAYPSVDFRFTTATGTFTNENPYVCWDEQNGAIQISLSAEL